jgi:hypothetical protein
MLFLLGAGFNIDANREAGPIINSYDGSVIPGGYPLVSAVLKLSFRLDKAPEASNLETNKCGCTNFSMRSMA